MVISFISLFTIFYIRPRPDLVPVPGHCALTLKECCSDTAVRQVSSQFPALFYWHYSALSLSAAVVPCTVLKFLFGHHKNATFTLVPVPKHRTRAPSLEGSLKIDMKVLSIRVIRQTRMTDLWFWSHWPTRPLGEISAIYALQRLTTSFLFRWVNVL